jgi:hypothetical protein
MALEHGKHLSGMGSRILRSAGYVYRCSSVKPQGREIRQNRHSSLDGSVKVW